VEQILHIERGDPEEAAELAQALDIGKILERHYPNHPWVISFQSKALIIRHLPIANAVTMATGKEGFGSVLPPGMVTPKNLTTEVVRHAGAMLEAFQLPRGPWDGRDPVVPADLIKAAVAGRSLS
jgi:hypothetical protein